MSEHTANGSRGGGVQSVERAFQILEAVAAAGGLVSLSELSTATRLPMPTIHRLIRTLLQLGYIRQEASRQYSLGPRLIRLGEVTSTMLGRWAQPYMEPLAQELGESVNLAILDNDEVLYVAQVMASRHSMRMFTEVGRRVPVHATAVGKAMLADAAPDQVTNLLARRGMPRYTKTTITTPAEFASALAGVRDQGYAIDEGEQEEGVRCVAVALPSSLQPMALSVSAPASRMTDVEVARVVGPLNRVAAAIAQELNGRSGTPPQRVPQRLEPVMAD